MKDGTCDLTIMPGNSRIIVKKGSRLLDALLSAGIGIDSACGGEGECGRCRVVIGNAKGRPTAQEKALLTPGELEQGHRLACMNYVDRDLELTIPGESTVKIHQILTTTGHATPATISPPSRKYTVRLPQPTLDDNHSDLSRLQRALNDECGIGNAAIAHGALRGLSAALRRHDWTVSATIVESNGAAEIISTGPVQEPGLNFGLAIDIGTTTIVITLTDLVSGAAVDTASDYNPQISRGEDVISRINHAHEEKCGLDELSGMVRDALDRLTQSLIKRNGIDRNCVTYAVISGNTTMVHLLYGINPHHIRLEPYIPSATSMPLLRAREIGLGINPDAHIYSIHGRSSFVGGDITADVLASGMHRGSELSMLIDVGTNGEVVLGSSDWLAGCSCSAGPAFEGGEVGSGIRAMKGAIEKVTVSGDFKVDYTVIGGGKPRGICGSGLIDLVADLFTSGIIDRAGRMRDIRSPLIRDGTNGREFIVAPASRTAIRKDLAISETDLKGIIRTKAAVYAACSVLLRKTGTELSGLSRIYIAGGFGNYINIEKAISIGLLPDIPRDKFAFIGNGALAGARLALLSKKLMSESEEIARTMTYIELSTDNTFFDEYSSAMFLPHTDLERFPTVAARLGKNADQRKTG